MINYHNVGEFNTNSLRSIHFWWRNFQCLTSSRHILIRIDQKYSFYSFIYLISGLKSRHTQELEKLVEQGRYSVNLIYILLKKKWTIVPAEWEDGIPKEASKNF